MLTDILKQAETASNSILIFGIVGNISLIVGMYMLLGVGGALVALGITCLWAQYRQIKLLNTLLNR